LGVSARLFSHVAVAVQDEAVSLPGGGPCKQPGNNGSLGGLPGGGPCKQPGNNGSLGGLSWPGGDGGLGSMSSGSLRSADRDRHMLSARPRRRRVQLARLLHAGVGSARGVGCAGAATAPRNARRSPPRPV
jgi:hypothetical protein